MTAADPLAGVADAGGAIPFADTPGAELSGDAVLAGRVVIAAATVPNPGNPAQLIPALVYRFVLPDRTYLPDVVIPLTVAELRDVAQLTADAVVAAIKAAT